MFRAAGLDLHDAGTDKEGVSDSAADIERIVSHKGVSQASTSNADLYTYVQDHEARHVPAAKIYSRTSGASTPQRTGRSSIDAILTTHDEMTSRDTTAPNGKLPFGIQRDGSQQPPQSQSLGHDQLSTLDRSQYIQQDVDMIMGDRAQYMMPNLAAGGDQSMGISPMSLHDFEAANKIWWDHSFDALDADPSGFLLGGYSGGEGGDYYIPSC